ncbi:hypothetical protein AB6A63_00005, partial ['Camptotheca acuminata' phytoplasma]
GARRTDVLKIFLTEGFVIFFLISCLLLICLTIPIDIVNWSGWTKKQLYFKHLIISCQMSTLINLKIHLNFGFVILIVTIINLFITFVSISSPIWKFSRKKPIEIILDK